MTRISSGLALANGCNSTARAIPQTAAGNNAGTTEAEAQQEFRHLAFFSCRRPWSPATGTSSIAEVSAVQGHKKFGCPLWDEISPSVVNIFGIPINRIVY